MADRKYLYTERVHYMCPNIPRQDFLTENRLRERETL